MATSAQIRKIHAAAREVGLDRDGMYDLVEQESGKRSVSSLTFAQADRVIDALVRAGARGGAGKKKPSGRRRAPGETPLVSGDVRSLIQELREQLGGDWVREEYFQGACKRLLRGKTRPATAADGARVVEMLKRRIAHQARRAK